MDTQVMVDRDKPRAVPDVAVAAMPSPADAVSLAARSVDAMSFLATLLSRALLTTVSAFLLWSLVPALGDWSTHVVVSGSMMPRVAVGDVVVSQPVSADTVTPGQVLLMENPARPGTMLMHRVVKRLSDDSLITRGDANMDVDSTPVPPANVRGLPRIRIPYAGLPMIWLHEGRYEPLAASVLVLLLAAYFCVDLARRGRAGPSPALVRRRTASLAARYRSFTPKLRRLWSGRVARRQRAAFAIVFAMLILVSWRSAPVSSAYTATRSTASSSWSSGTVTFGANTPAAALFTVTGAKPGSTETTCLKVSYTGSLAATVRLYVASGGLTGTGLGSYMNLQINEGTGAATGGSCTDFAQTANVYNPTGLSDNTKTLAAFAGASTNYATGLSSWSATNGTTKTYQFIWRLQALNAAVNKTASVTFTWEAQS